MRGRGLSLVAAMALLGVAFNVKMLAALVCGPALLAGWWLAGTARLAAPARLDGGGGRHARGGVAVLVGRLRPHAQGQAALCRQHRRAIRCSSWWSSTTASTASSARVPKRHRARRRRSCRISRPTTRCRRAVAARHAAARRAVRLAAAARGARPVRAAAARPASSVARPVGRLARHLRHRLQRRRRHLPHLLSVGAGAAGRGTGRHRCGEAVAPWAGLAGRRPRPLRRVADLRRRRLARLDVALARLPDRRARRGRRRRLARQAAARCDRRPGPAGPAAGLGAEPGLLAGQPDAALGQPAALARPRRRPRPAAVAQLRGAQRRPQAARLPGSPIAARRASSSPRRPPSSSRR